MPTGGPEDRRPPVVVATFPAPFDTLVDLQSPIRFEFDERISERAASGTLEDAITISPKGGVVRVEQNRRSLEARVAGGLRPGVVYRATLQPVVVDLFGNTMVDPFELVFTTGGDVVPTTLAGQVWDRTTGRGVGPAVVHAVGADSLVHRSVTDRQGIFAFRYLPAGAFQVVAFDDRDRDDEPDTTETRGRVPVSLSAGDTVLVDVPILAPDTLPAVVQQADALDSVTVVVVFDDFLDPDVSGAMISGSLARQAGDAPAVDTVLHEHEYLAFRSMVADSLARLDSLEAAERAAQALPADTAAPTDTVAPVGPPDTTGVPPDTVGVPPDTVPAPADTGVVAPPRHTPPVDLAPLQGGRPGPLEGTDRLVPGRRIVLMLREPLERDVEYGVEVSSVVNLNGLSGGGGEATFTLEALPDTAGVGR